MIAGLFKSQSSVIASHADMKQIGLEYEMKWTKKIMIQEAGLDEPLAHVLMICVPSHSYVLMTPM